MERLEPIIDEINKITNNDYNFSLKSATLYEDADFCVVKIFYRDGIILDKNIKLKVKSKILELCPINFKYEIKFIKNFVSEEKIETDVKEFMKKNYNSISFEIENIVCEDLIYTINLKIDCLAISHAREKNLDKVIEKYLRKKHHDCKFKCNIIEDKIFNNIVSESKIIKNDDKNENSEAKLRKIVYTDIEPIIGEKFDEPASYIVDIQAEMQDVIICGKIKKIDSFLIKKKSENDKNLQNGSNLDEKIDEFEENIEIKKENIEQKNERKIFKITIEGFTGTIVCNIMQNKSNISKLEYLKIDDSLAVCGDIIKSNFNGSLSLFIKKMEYCKLPETFEEYIEYKKEKDFYEFVKPEPIIVYRQDDLLSFAVEKPVPKYLQNKTFVCYDLETTGLHFENGDRMVEIGAVKIVNGKITEKFVSYVNPDGKHIDSGASATTGIYDEDVANAPKDYEILQDFYKFTRNSIIIGYNIINFDNAFLFGQGKKCRYNFDNQVEDVFRFAQKYVRDVKNYKLGTIADKLGVVLDKAHSAVYDALATAEVFLKIAEIMN